jgi:NTP pyrophosphatase (non-canonical NTP hydrolase)
VTDDNNAPKTEPLINVTLLNEALEKFATDRDWAQFHSPKNLVMALTGEIGELSEIFQWMTEAQSRTAGTDPNTAQAVGEELADVQLYLVRLASVLGIDLNEAVQDKLQKNAEKYPADKARGSSKKYTEL